MRYAKNTLIFFFFLITTIGNAYADEFKSADFLASQWLLVNNSGQPENYNIGSKISRKEFISIIINLSGGTTKTGCEYNFTDVLNDWWCKYIDEAFERGYIVKNDTFNPDQDITRGEALGLIFKAKDIEVTPTIIWQKAYFDEAVSRGFMEDQIYLYSFSAKREWIFGIAANTYSEYESFSQEDFIFQSAGKVDSWASPSFQDILTKNIQNRPSSVVKNTETWELEWEYIETFDNWNIKLKNFYTGWVLFWETIWYYYDGSLNFKGTYKWGRLEWAYIKYYQNGNIAFEEYYTKGLLSGICTYYDENASIIRKREYIWGFLLREF